MIQAKTWMDLKDIMLIKKAKLTRSHTVWLHLYNMLKITKLQRWRKLVVARDLGCWEGGEWVWLWRSSTRGVFVVMEEFCILIAAVVTRIYMWENDTELYTLHHVNFLVLILYPNYVRCNHWGKLGKEHTYSVILYMYANQWCISSQGTFLWEKPVKGRALVKSLLLALQ